MPKITLIQPVLENKSMDRNIKTIYPLGLGYIAAYIPEHWDVEIVDEQIESIDFNLKVDLVGITTTTLTVNRAIEIAKEFRKRGVAIIMGGVHASLCPQDVAPYCDSIVIGDGEHVMEQMIKDFEKGKLKKKYHAKYGPLVNLKQPRRDLFKNGYSFIPVSSSRGCPFNCNFCAINRYYDGTYRTRAVEDVIDELKNLPKGNNVVFFSDGNMYGYSKNDIKRFKDLCRRIAEEQRKKTLNFKYFAGYGSVNALADLEALDLASAAGCRAIFVGFESINPASLKEMNKTLNLKYGVDSYPELVQNAQKRNMLVVGEMIMGNDSDSIDVLKKTGEFLKKIHFDVLRLQILQPLPGTKLFEMLERENRLLLKKFPEDWDKVANGHIMGVHFLPKNISAHDLQVWVQKTGLQFYSPFNILKRALQTLRMTGNLSLALLAVSTNFKSRKSYANAKL